MRAKKNGFSLTELLVAMAVLAILGLLITQITTSVTRTTKQSNRIIDAATQSRLAFDRIGQDLAGLVKRDDTDFQANIVATGSTGNVLLFLSSVPSKTSGITSANNRGISMIAYAVANHDDNNKFPCLVRSGKSIPWNTTGGIPKSGFMGLRSNGLPIQFTDADFPPQLRPTGITDYDVLAPGVIRMIVGYQLYPDNQPVEYLDGGRPNPNKAQGQIVYSPPIKYLTPNNGSTAIKYIDLSRISAIVVGLVAIDLNSQKLLTPEQARSLGNTFALPPNSANTTPVKFWYPTVNSPSAMPTDIALPVRQSVYIFEQFYPITPFASKKP